MAESSDQALSDDDLLKVYASGFAGGAASTALNMGNTPEVATRFGRSLTSRMLQDPAARHEILTNVRALLEGRQTPEFTMLPEAGR